MRIRLKQFDNLKLSLGCGKKDEADFLIDVPDLSEFVGLDERDLGQEIVWKVGGIPLPDESCLYVWCAHFLEHFDETEILEVMDEIWRVLKKGCLLEIRVPDQSSPCSIMPYHKQIMHKNYFDIFRDPGLTDYGHKLWTIEKVEMYSTVRGNDLKIIMKRG